MEDRSPALPDAPQLTPGEEAGSDLPAPRLNQTRTGIKPKAPPEAEADLADPGLYFNRELSHLQFNIRVLEQALDEAHPLLNRLMFLLIFSSNMDEFFEIRVAGLKRRIAIGDESAGFDGRSPRSVVAEISRVAHEQIERQYRILNEVLLPALEEKGLRFRRRSEWTQAQRDWVSDYFEREILPVISPIGLDPSHPFPRLVNKSLNFIVQLEGKDAFGREGGLAILPAPRSLPRVIALPRELCEEGFDEAVFLSSMIHAHAAELFPGMKVRGCYQFRLTRNADMTVDPEEVSDLASALRGELLARRYGSGVRLEVVDTCPDELATFLLGQFELAEEDLYRVNGPVNLTRMMSLLGEVDRPELLYRSYTPGLPKNLQKGGSLFDAIAAGDILLHHPFSGLLPAGGAARRGGPGPRGAGHQADPLPHRRRLPHRQLPGGGGAGRQGGHRGGGAARPLRRGGQPGPGVAAAGGRRHRHLRRDGLQDPRQDDAHGAPGEGAAAPLRPPGHRQLPLQDRQALYRLQPADRQRGALRGCPPGLPAALGDGPRPPYRDAAPRPLHPARGHGGDDRPRGGTRPQGATRPPDHQVQLPD